MALVVLRATFFLADGFLTVDVFFLAARFLATPFFTLCFDVDFFLLCFFVVFLLDFLVGTDFLLAFFLPAVVVRLIVFVLVFLVVFADSRLARRSGAVFYYGDRLAGVDQSPGHRRGLGARGYLLVQLRVVNGPADLAENLALAEPHFYQVLAAQ